jgi:hypothetical protein
MKTRLFAGVRIVGLTTILSIAFLSSACTPNLVPSVKQMRFPEYVQRSSVVVIGKVSSVGFTRRLAKTPDERKMVVRLVKADVLIENVLKGDVHGRNMAFYFYYPAYGFSLPSLNIIGPHDRAILFLRWDHGALRSVNDVYESCIHLATGSHPDLKVGPQKTVEQAITEACILPGSKGDLNRQSWPYLIEHGAHVGEELIGSQRTVELLNSLLNYPDYRVKTEACLAAANLSPTKPSCLYQLQTDRGFGTAFDLHVRQQLYSLMVRYHYDFGDPLPGRLPIEALPGVADVRLDMKRVMVWWPL